MARGGVGLGPDGWRRETSVGVGVGEGAVHRTAEKGIAMCDEMSEKAAAVMEETGKQESSGVVDKCATYALYLALVGRGERDARREHAKILERVLRWESVAR